MAASDRFSPMTLRSSSSASGTLSMADAWAFTAGSVDKNQPRNEFLSTKKEFGDFELALKWKLIGTEGFVNGGVQFRTKRIPNHHEVSGYQADLGAGTDGSLYDESRRNKMLAQPAKEVLEKAKKPLGEWNTYRIRAEGPRTTDLGNYFLFVGRAARHKNVGTLLDALDIVRRRDPSIRVVLAGGEHPTREGAIVPGYESDMPAFEGRLTEAEVRAALGYIKSTWPERERAFQAEVTSNDEDGT